MRVKATGQIAKATDSNGHAYKVSKKWFHEDDLDAITVIDTSVPAADGVSYRIVGCGDQLSTKRLVWCHPMASSIANDDDEMLWDSWNQPKAAAWCTIRIDAQGHGKTPPQVDKDTIAKGEDEVAKLFDWKAVGESMYVISEAVEPKVEKLIVGGASMGSGGALWAACNRGGRALAGMVMCIPPTCYETRDARADKLRENAYQGVADYYANKQPRKIFNTAPPEALRKPIPEEGVRKDGFKEVMLGSAISNFPSRETVQKELEGLPVLICGWEGDPTHPMSSTDELEKLIPHAEVHRAKTLAEMDGIWSKAIADWIEKL